MYNMQYIQLYIISQYAIRTRYILLPLAPNLCKINYPTAKKWKRDAAFFPFFLLYQNLGSNTALKSMGCWFNPGRYRNSGLPLPGSGFILENSFSIHNTTFWLEPRSLKFTWSFGAVKQRRGTAPPGPGSHQHSGGCPCRSTWKTEEQGQLWI